jgi:hypothetical protein
MHTAEILVRDLQISALYRSGAEVLADGLPRAVFKLNRYATPALTLRFQAFILKYCSQ